MLFASKLTNFFQLSVILFQYLLWEQASQAQIRKLDMIKVSKSPWNIKFEID